MNTETQKNRIGRVIDHLIDAGEYIHTAPDYAERGYCMDDENGIVVFANWNPPRCRTGKMPALTREENRMPRAAEILERLGCEIEWSDEWTTCCDCGRAVRMQPDSYDWQPSYVVFNDCEIVCENCVAEDPDEYFESLDGSTSRSHHISAINPADHGYFPNDEWFESGYHPWQTDDPGKIAGILESHGIGRFFFETASSQFYVSFRVWIHDDERGHELNKAIQEITGA